MSYLSLLSAEDVTLLHEVTMDILSRIGMGCKSAKLKEIVVECGCEVQDDRIFFPVDVVEKYLKKVPSHFNLYGRDGRTVLEMGSRKAYAQICSGTPSVIDLETGQRREYLLKDLAQITRLANSLENIDIVSCGVPEDVSEKTYMEVEVATMLQNTTKPLRLPIESAREMQNIEKILNTVAGSMDNFKQKPFLYLEISPLSPLDFAKDPADALIALVEKGIPVGIIPCPMMGATGPMTIAGSAAQHNAELVAAVIATQMVSPGSPVIMSPRVTFMDMKSGVGLWAAPEMGLAAACSAHLAQYYNIPVSTSAFSVASKALDQQSGYERCFNALTSAFLGVDVLAAAGSLDNALVLSYEQLVIDDEISSMVKRALKGVTVNKDTLAVGVIEKVIKDKSSFLSQKHTRNYMRSGEIWNPPLGDRTPFEVWAKSKELIEEKAKQKAKDILTKDEIIMDEKMDKELNNIIRKASEDE